MRQEEVNDSDMSPIEIFWAVIICIAWLVGFIFLPHFLHILINL